MQSIKIKEAVKTVRYLLNDSNAVILDTETTGLGDTSEILELSIIDTKGNVLFDRLFMPYGLIPEESTACNGIDKQLLIDNKAGRLKDSVDEIKSVLEGKRIIAYNVNFDYKQLTKYVTTNKSNWICAMMLRKAIEESIKYSKLEGNHRALGDCRATLELLIRLADTPIESGDMSYVDLQNMALELDQMTKDRLAITKKEEALKEAIKVELEKRGLLDSGIVLPDQRVLLVTKGVSKPKLNCSIDDIEFLLGSDVVDRSPRLRSTTNLFRDACLNGSLDGMIEFEITYKLTIK